MLDADVTVPENPVARFLVLPKIKEKRPYDTLVHVSQTAGQWSASIYSPKYQHVLHKTAQGGIWDEGKLKNFPPIVAISLFIWFCAPFLFLLTWHDLSCLCYVMSCLSQFVIVGKSFMPLCQSLKLYMIFQYLSLLLKLWTFPTVPGPSQ